MFLLLWGAGIHGDYLPVRSLDGDTTVSIDADTGNIAAIGAFENDNPAPSTFLCAPAYGDTTALVEKHMAAVAAEVSAKVSEETSEVPEVSV